MDTYLWWTNMTNPVCRGEKEMHKIWMDKMITDQVTCGPQHFSRDNTDLYEVEGEGQTRVTQLLSVYVYTLLLSKPIPVI